MLIDDLLLLARLDEGRPLAAERVDLVAVLEDAVDAARAVGPDWPITVDAVPSAEVIGDPMALRQVDRQPARQRPHAHTGRHGRHGARADRRGRRRPGEVVLEVADEGPGLDAVDVERVFERFYRVDTSRSRDRGGSGLGLAVVAALVAAHDGSVDVESSPGAGATFRVHLAARAGDDLVPAEGAPAGGARRERYSLVGPVNRGARFSRWAASPSAASGTAEAVELVRQRRVEHRAERAVPVVQRVLRPADRALRRRPRAPSRSPGPGRATRRRRRRARPARSARLPRRSACGR